MKERAPHLLFGLAIGAWVDRTNRKRVMVFTDCAHALVIASIPLLTILGVLSVWWIYVASFVNATLISTYSMTQRIVPNALLGRVITFIRVLTWPTGARGHCSAAWHLHKPGM